MNHENLLDRLAAHARATFALVDAGQLDPHAAIAGLACDALAASCATDLPDELRADLLEMAQHWAVRRARGLTAEMLLAETPVPDDASAIASDGTDE